MVSIIIPVYNTEKYLEECLDSVLTQSFKNIEIILLDDGLTDHSGDICDKYSRQDERIIVVHQKNKGLSGARNAGLDLAKGDYFMFVDSDDYVRPDYVGHMVELLEQEKEADIAICRFYNCYEQENGTYLERPCISQPEQRVLNGVDILPRRFGSMKVFYVLAFNKLFRSEIFNKIRFPEAQLCEDAWVLLDYYQISRKVVCTDEMLYCYRSRKDSISRTPTFRWIDDQLKWLEKELYFFAEAGQPKNMVYPAQNYVSLLYRNRNMYNKENCEERENGWDIAIKALLADDNLSIID